MKAPNCGGYCFPAVSAGNSSLCVYGIGSYFLMISDSALYQITTSFTSPGCPRPLIPSEEKSLNLVKKEVQA